MAFSKNRRSHQRYYAQSANYSSGEETNGSCSQLPQPARSAEEALWRAAKRMTSMWRWMKLDLVMMAEHETHADILESMEFALLLLGRKLLPNLGKHPLSGEEACRQEVIDLVGVLGSIGCQSQAPYVAREEKGSEDETVEKCAPPPKATSNAEWCVDSMPAVTRVSSGMQTSKAKRHSKPVQADTSSDNYRNFFGTLLSPQDDHKNLEGCVWHAIDSDHCFAVGDLVKTRKALQPDQQNSPFRLEEDVIGLVSHIDEDGDIRITFSDLYDLGLTKAAATVWIMKPKFCNLMFCQRAEQS